MTLKADILGVYYFDEIPATRICFELFTCSSDVHFLTFYFFAICLVVSTFIIPNYLWFYFSLSVRKLSWVGSSIPFLVSLFPFLIISMVYFLIPNSIAISWLYILIVWIKFFFFFFMCMFIFGQYLKLYAMAYLFLVFYIFVAAPHASP